MPLGSDLLDTNAAIAWFADDGGLPARYLGRDVSVSVITLGELRFGAYKSIRTDDNNRRLDRFETFIDVLSVTREIASKYGELKQHLRAAGKPIPDNDLWIAATAIAHNLTLVTQDKHFASLPGLAVNGW